MGKDKVAAGVKGKSPKAGMVDPKGAWTKVQERTIGNMKMGGSLKPVDKTEKPGLAKLPTPVRNKMGYQKNGGKMSKKK
jgi:hypothetical protein